MIAVSLEVIKYLSRYSPWSTGEMTAAQVTDNSDGSYTASFVAQQIGEVMLSISIYS